ncbi:MAG: amidohydrolase family protein [Acidobacteria bacterium]|nr:amidohydrolase family protein [Acidobacteriota bacterium]
MFSICGAGKARWKAAGKVALVTVSLYAVALGFYRPVLAEEASWVVFNGKIATVDEKNTIVEAMAIRDDVILALGKNEDILKLAGPNTKKVDVKGRTVLPGIVDPHWHLANYLDEDFPEIRGIRIPPSPTMAETKKDIEEAIKKKVKELKSGEWILVYPTGNVARELILFEEITHADLDRVAPNNPVMLNEAGSGPNSQILLNSKARELTEHEFPGLKRFSDRDVKGVGTDLSATVVKDVVFKGREEDFAKSLKKFLISTTPSSGITTAGTIITRVPLNAFGILDRKGELPLRFGWLYGYAAYYDPDGFYKRFPDISGIGSKYLFNMGVGEELTDSPATGLCTTLPIENTELKERFGKMMLDTCFLNHPARRATVKDQIQYGRPVEYHAGGDKSIDILIDIIDEIRRETGMTAEEIRRKRITMEHTLLVRPDQIPKLKEYGIIMTLASGHMTNQLNPNWPSNIRKNYNSEYIRWHQPAKDLINGGVHTILAEVGGKPFAAMQRFITREACFTPRLPGEGEIGKEKCETLVPGQAVDRVTALRLSTIWPAYYALKEKEVGSLENGKFADLIVVDQDFFEVPEKELSNIKILMTVLGGQVIYAAPEFGPVDRALFKSPDYFGKAVLSN